MDFTGQLDPATQHRVDQCDQLLRQPARLAALARTGLMDTPSELAFDRLAHLAARILGAPLTIVSLVGADKQFFKASFGLPPPYDVSREIPIDGSICRYTLAGEPLIVDDASSHPLLMHHPATKPWGIGAFIALPMMTDEGQALGAFCAVGREKRRWSEDDIYIMRELTASVMTEIQLRLQLNELREQRQLRERIMSAITHDLRTPIAAALMNAQRLEKRVGDGLQKAAHRIVDSMDRADRMIGDLLDSSRLQAGEGMALVCAEGDLRALAVGVLDEMTAVHGARFVLEGEGPVLASFDASAMQRVLENLLGNAVKYGAAAAPITVQARCEAADALLVVHNQGDPIPAQEQPTLFDAFRRSPAAECSDQAGWGIGLNLVRGIVEAHQGCVTLQSNAAAGTSFTVRLPRSQRAGLPPA